MKTDDEKMNNKPEIKKLAEKAANNILAIHMRDACEKHPVFAESVQEALNVIAEEMLELTRSVNDNEPLPDILSEAADLATTATRFCSMLQEKIWTGK